MCFCEISMCWKFEENHTVEIYGLFWMWQCPQRKLHPVWILHVLQDPCLFVYAGDQTQDLIYTKQAANQAASLDTGSKF